MSSESQSNGQPRSNGNTLRPEAAAFELGRLSDNQLKTFRFVAEKLKQAYDGLRKLGASASKAEPHSGLGWRVDNDRASRLVFIDGDRGTGKSSVLLTLVKATTNGYGDSWKPSEEADEGRQRREVAAYIVCSTELQKRLVWLEPLDLESASARASNPLAAILVRIADAAEHCMGAISTRCHEDFDDVLHELSQLQTDAALAWRGDPPEGGDPDTYAEHAKRAARVSLKLNKQLEDVLDKLAKLLAGSRGIRDPLFVLPVDDIDLAPQRAPDLLRVLRMLSTPRLFTVLLGKVDDLESVMAADIAGHLVDVSKKASGDDGIKEDRALIARQTAAHGLRKLVPPSQRTRLELFSIEEACQFRPHGYDDGDLEGLMRRVPLEASRG
jgi:hypothetical protein